MKKERKTGKQATGGGGRRRHGEGPRAEAPGGKPPHTAQRTERRKQQRPKAPHLGSSFEFEAYPCDRWNAALAIVSAALDLLRVLMMTGPETLMVWRREAKTSCSGKSASPPPLGEASWGALLSTNVSIAIVNMPLRDLAVLSGRFRRPDPGGAKLNPRLPACCLLTSPRVVGDLHRGRHLLRASSGT